MIANMSGDGMLDVALWQPSGIDDVISMRGASDCGSFRSHSYSTA